MNDHTPARLIEILLVEDSPGDVRLTQEALKDAKVANRLHVVGDGQLAMDFVRRRGPYSYAPRPDLILLDLNLSRKDGREVLAELKADADLKRIPVVVLTTSKAEEDVLRAYDLHCNMYVAKPIDFDSFISVVKQIDGLWLSIVSLPPR